MKRIVAVSIFLFFVLHSSFGAPIPGQVRKAVGFIFVPGPNDQRMPNGTCFFVYVKDQTHTGRGWGYLVTAKHVLQDTSDAFYPKVWVRLNKKSGGVENFELPLASSGTSRNIFIHPDSSVDLAVVPVAEPDPNVYEVSAIDEDLLTSEKDFSALNIREGSDIFFTGMFLPYIGANRNYPIVRFGKVALLTDEKVMWNQVPTDLYLIETLSFGGNSGAPVFFYLGTDREPGSIMVGAPILKLAGIMEGFFNDFEPIAVVETRAVPVSKLNSGIAAVTPAYKLHQILYSQELQNTRK